MTKAVSLQYVQVFAVFRLSSGRAVCRRRPELFSLPAAVVLFRRSFSGPMKQHLFEVRLKDESEGRGDQFVDSKTTEGAHNTDQGQSSGL